MGAGAGLRWGTQRARCEALPGVTQEGRVGSLTQVGYDYGVELRVRGGADVAKRRNGRGVRGCQV